MHIFQNNRILATKKDHRKTMDIEKSVCVCMIIHEKSVCMCEYIHRFT